MSTPAAGGRDDLPPAAVRPRRRPREKAVKRPPETRDAPNPERS